MKWLPFLKPKPVIAVSVTLIERDRVSLRLHELRADERMAAGMASALNNQYMVVAADVLRNEHPAFNVLPPDAPEHVRAAHQAKCEGYTLCLANLLSMGTHQKINPELIADFSDEELDRTVNRK